MLLQVLFIAVFVQAFHSKQLKHKAPAKYQFVRKFHSTAFSTSELGDSAAEFWLHLTAAQEPQRTPDQVFAKCFGLILHIETSRHSCIKCWLDEISAWHVEVVQLNPSQLLIHKAAVDSSYDAWSPFCATTSCCITAFQSELLQQAKVKWKRFGAIIFLYEMAFESKTRGILQRLY